MKFTYLKYDEHLRELLSNFEKLKEIFDYLMMRLNADPEETFKVMKDLQDQGFINSTLDLEGFKEELLNQHIIEPNPSGAKLTPKGERRLRENAFNEIFKNIKKKGKGNHLASIGSNHLEETLPEKRTFIFGDDPKDIDYSSSLFNSIRRSNDFEMPLKEEDLEVFDKEVSTGCANVLMIDISHSMILYGEDRITPAKQVAMAFTELLLTQYPKDDLNIILFGDDAREVTIKELPYIHVGPYHTNTQAGLQMARQILSRKKQANKQILMITDGKPSMMKRPDGSLYKNSFGLDPKIVSATLDEASFCRKKNIDITTFMITKDPTLIEFIERLTELNQGKAFYSSVDDLGSFLLTNYVTNRKKFFR